MEATEKAAPPPPQPSEHDRTVMGLERDLRVLTTSLNATQDDWSRMEARLHKALSRWPDSAALQFYLGTFYQITDRAGAAITLIRASRGATPKEGTPLIAGPDPLLNEAGAWKVEHNDEEAESCYLKALAAVDVIPEALRNERKASIFHGLASLYINRGKPEMVLHWAEKALACKPDDRFGLWNKGLALLEMGRWGEGFDLYDHAGFLDTQGKPRDRKLREYGGKLKRWTGEKGQGVVCYGEQGVGDEIMFFSILPDLIRDSAEVVVECDKRIINLLRNSFPGVAFYPTSDINAPYDWLKDHPNITHFVPCGSLGMYYRREDKDFPRTPYFKAEPHLVERWGKVLADCPRPRIAFSWAGGLKKTRLDKRSLELPMLRPILEQDATFFSLQYHPFSADQCAAFGTELGKPIIHWEDVVGGPAMPGYSNTAAFLSHVDLCITVNTSLVHLAGALGVPTLCLTPVMSAWRYSRKSGPHPFYGNVTQLNQSVEGEWGPVIEEAAKRVADLIAEHQANTATGDMLAETIAAAQLQAAE